MLSWEVLFNFHISSVRKASWLEAARGLPGAWCVLCENAMCSERRDKLSISSEREEGGRSCTDVSRWRQWSPHHHLHLHHNIQHTRCTNQRHGHSSSTTTIYQVFRLFAATTTNTSRNISPSLERRQRQHSGSDSAVFSLCLSPLWRQRKIKLTLNNWWSWLSTQHHTQRRLLIFQEFENFSQFSLINLKTRYHFVILNIERIFMKILAHVWLVEIHFSKLVTNSTTYLVAGGML